MPAAQPVVPVQSGIPTDIRVFRGFYRKFEDQSSFMPCGTSTLLDVTGTLVARGILKERFRWFASNEGDRMYAVFRGALVTDTPTVADTSGGSTRGMPRTRFFLVDVDSFRTWRISDCNGMKVPRITRP